MVAKCHCCVVKERPAETNENLFRLLMEVLNTQ